jgi:hypothetical protein
MKPAHERLQAALNLYIKLSETDMSRDELEKTFKLVLGVECHPFLLYPSMDFTVDLNEIGQSQLLINMLATEARDTADSLDTLEKNEQ